MKRDLQDDILDDVKRFECNLKFRNSSHKRGENYKIPL